MNKLLNKKKTCCVASCNRSKQENSVTKVRYHLFPKDKKLSKIWMNLCARKDRNSVYPYKFDKICSVHFCSNQYKQEKNNLSKPWYLKENAVPCQSLPSKQLCKCEESVISEPYQRQNCKRKLTTSINDESHHQIRVTNVKFKKQKRADKSNKNNIDIQVRSVNCSQTLSNPSQDLKKENLTSTQPLQSNNFANKDSELSTQPSQNRKSSTKSRKIKITKLMSKNNDKTNAVSTTNILPPKPPLEMISFNETLSNSSQDFKKENLPSTQPLQSNNLANMDSELSAQPSQNRYYRDDNFNKTSSETFSNPSQDFKKENLTSTQPLQSNNFAYMDSELSTQPSQNSVQDIDIVKVELPEPNLVSNYGSDQNNYYEIKDVRNFIIELQQKNMKLSHELGLKSKKLVEVQTFLERRSTYLSDKLSIVSDQYTEIENILKSVFSNSQIARLKNKNCRIGWTKSDIVSARALYTESKESYHYLRDKMGIPLPSETTLKEWKRSETISNDISDEMSSPSIAQ